MALKKLWVTFATKQFRVNFVFCWTHLRTQSTSSGLSMMLSLVSLLLLVLHLLLTPPQQYRISMTMASFRDDSVLNIFLNIELELKAQKMRPNYQPMRPTN